MSDRLTGAMVTALSTGIIRDEYLVELAYDEPDRFWTGPRDLVWNGSTWNTTSRPESFANIEESLELRAINTQLAFTGIPGAYISLALSENYRGKIGTIYLACFNSTDPTVPLADPIEIYSGYIDTQTIKDTGDTASIIVSMESLMADFERLRLSRYTHEDQQIDHSGDLGLEYVAALANKEITLGK